MDLKWKVAIGAGIVLGGYLYVAYRKPSKPVRVLAIGDSLTAAPAYCAALNDQLPAGSTLVCRGLSGQGTGPILSDLREQVSSGYNYVVILAGVNDLASGRPMETIQSNLEKMWLEARASGARVVAVKLTPWAGHHLGKDLVAATDELNHWIRIHRLPDRVVDTMPLGDFTGRLRSQYAAGDGLHLNPEGSARLAELVWMQGF